MVIALMIVIKKKFIMLILFYNKNDLQLIIIIKAGVVCEWIAPEEAIWRHCISKRLLNMQIGELTVIICVNKRMKKYGIKSRCYRSYESSKYEHR